MTEILPRTTVSLPRMLVLSDIQFGPFGLKVESAAETAHAILRALRVEAPDDISFVILPGDLTSIASEEEFTALRKFLDVLLDEGGGLRPQGVLMCPGNHDLTAMEGTSESGRFENFQRFARSFYLSYWERFGAHRIACAPWLGVSALTGTRPLPPVTFNSGNDLWTVYQFNDRLLALALNSAAEIKPKTFRPNGAPDTWDPSYAFGFVNEAKQLEPAAVAFDEVAKRAPELPRLAILHHNIAHGRPINARLAQAAGQMTMVHNYMEIAEKLQKLQISLVVHGHQHEPLTSVYQIIQGASFRQGDLDSPLTIFGAGTLGAAITELEADPRRRFHLVQFDARDPCNDRVIQSKTYYTHMKFGGQSDWSLEHDETASVIVPRKRRTDEFDGLADKLPIITAKTFGGALEQFTAFSAGRIGERAFGVSIVKAEKGGADQVKASSLSKTDLMLLGALYLITGETLTYRYENIDLEVGLLKRRSPETINGAPAESQILYLQSQLSGHDTLAYRTYWFRIKGADTFGIRILLSYPTAVRLDHFDSAVLSLQRTFLMLLTYWSLFNSSDLYQGALKEELETLLPVLRYNHPRAISLEAWRSASEEILGLSICGQWGSSNYRRLEASAYYAKRNIERLIVYTLIHEHISKLPANSLDLNTIQNSLRLRLGSLLAPLTWNGKSHGRGINPLLVAFWVPKVPIDTRSGLEATNFTLRYLLTRDQIAHCTMKASTEHRDRAISDLKQLSQKKMRSYKSLIFDGVAAYACATEAPFFTLDAYSEPLVAFGSTALPLLKGLTEEQRRLVNIFKKRSKERAQLTDLEMEFWQPHKGTMGALCAPMYGPFGIEAVIQIQTDNISLIETLRGVDFFNVLDGINLNFFGPLGIKSSFYQSREDEKTRH